MTLSAKILVGGGCGIALGLFIGEYARALDWAAQGFVRLLQMTVLPYVTVSIITSLGTLRAADARELLLRASAVVAGLWAIAILFAFLVPVAFPAVQTGAFFSTSLVEQRPSFDFVGLYIPENPFHALANNIVPAVVLFSVLVGITLIGIERKQPLLDVLRVAQDALQRANGLVARLMPYGLFAMAATTAGTMRVDQLSRVQVFVVTYTAVSLFLSLWVLPGLVAVLTPVGMRELLGRMRVPFLTAFMVGDLFVVLPLLIEGSRELLARHEAGHGRAAAVADVIVPASFNFPHTAKMLSISFILFAGWYSDAAVAFSDYPALALTGLVTFFGSLNAAVPFLLDLFRIPADTFQLFLGTGIINARFGTLLAASHTATVAVLGSCAATRTLRLQPAQLVRYLATTTAMTVILIGGLRLLFAQAVQPVNTQAQVLANMQLLTPPAEVAVREEDASADGRPRLEQIRERARLRVGYIPDALPFSYVNAQGTLVGFDIEMAHRLARELGVALEFSAVERDRLREPLLSGECDLIMAGVAVTTLRARDVLFSQPYLDETVAFIVRDHDRGNFVDWDTVRAQGPLRVAVPNIPYYIDKVKEALPEARIVPVHDIRDIFEERLAFDAAVLQAERGSAWTLLYPQFSVVVPGPTPVRVPLAYPLARDDGRFESFLNTWLELKRRDGTIDALYRHWILGQSPTTASPRWSIMRDVLGWVT